MYGSRQCTYALIQMEVRGGEMEWNLAHALDLISEAASHGAQVAVLPECMDLGWTDPSSLAGADEIPGGKVCQALQKGAHENSIYICSGLTERAGDDVYNAAVIIDKHGEILCHHRKINELEIAHPYYTRGDRLTITKTEFGNWGLMICADGFAKDRVLSRSLGMMGAEVILSPCAWAVPKDHDNLKEPYGDLWRESYVPVAREFSTTIIGVSNVGVITGGPWKGRNCIGCSLVIGPDGEEIIQAAYGVDAESILYVDLKPNPKRVEGRSNLDFGRKKRDSGAIMKSNFTRSFSLILALCFICIGFTLAAGPPPSLSAVQAVQIAQKDLDDRNMQGTVFIAQLNYKSKIGGDSYWEVYWSKRFPANTKGFNEVGLHIKMDGNYTRTVKR